MSSRVTSLSLVIETSVEGCNLSKKVTETFYVFVPSQSHCPAVSQTNAPWRSTWLRSRLPTMPHP